MSDFPNRHIDVYPVGLLSDRLFLRNAIKHGHSRQGWGRFRNSLRHLRAWMREKNWRAVKNYFNGYLAEHEYAGTRAGHGWTKRRALRDLERHLAQRRGER